MRQLSSDLYEFIGLLNTKQVKYVIVGAWALAFHGRPRYTGDLDLFVERAPDNASKLMAVITEFGFGGMGIEREDFLQENYVIQLGVAPNRIDLLTGISGVTFAEAWTSRNTGKISGIEAPIISRELLIKNKRAANRDKDRGDILLLEKTQPAKR